MKHNNIVRGIVICMVVLFVALCVILATPAGAYDGNPIWTKKQIALHEAAEILRAAGISDDAPTIRRYPKRGGRSRKTLIFSQRWSPMKQTRNGANGNTPSPLQW